VLQDKNCIRNFRTRLLGRRRTRQDNIKIDLADRTGSGSCAIADFGTDCLEPLNYVSNLSYVRKLISSMV
jgi:hypothetical protein